MFTKERTKIGRIRRSGVYEALPQLPPCECFFDAFHGGLGVGIFPFALASRTFLANQSYLQTIMGKKYRIRKLTPTECFALMGVRERERERLASCGVSESQQYKMAGNSIVVDVLMGIFGQMFHPQEKIEENQLTFPWW